MSSKPSNLSALALVNSHEIRADKTELAQLQGSIVQQFRLMRRLREEEALRGLLVGLALWRIKASLPPGQFGKWQKANVVEFGERYVNYMMKLALAFATKARVAVPDMLALPGAQAELTLDGMEAAQRRFVEKAIKFVGKKSLHELFLQHGIKESKKLGGAREKTAAEAGSVPDEETLYLSARDEIGGWLQRGEEMFLKENRLQLLAAHHDEIRGAVASLLALASKVSTAAKPLLTTKK